MNTLLDAVRDFVRSGAGQLAKLINSASNGKITPNMITITGLLAHIYIAWLIAQRSFVIAAILLIIFGLFDTLDGQLARLQKTASSAGMLLDATTDRMKEVLLYTGAAYALLSVGNDTAAVWAVAACGGSLLVSYVKAKGETAMKSSKLSANEINRIFADGFLCFEVRMFLLVLGLLSGYLGTTIVVIAVLAWLTSFQRLYLITKKLNDA